MQRDKQSKVLPDMIMITNTLESLLHLTGPHPDRECLPSAAGTNRRKATFIYKTAHKSNSYINFISAT